MNSNYLKLIYCFFTLYPLFGFGEGWVHITTKNDIDIYSKLLPNSPIKALRAEGLVNGRIEDIVAILRDVASAKEWVPNLVDRSYVQNISDTEAVLYDVNDLPWPVTDRDSVVHHKLSISEDQKSLILNFNSTEHENAPKGKKYIRAIISKGEIVFTPKANKTYVRVTILVDPMGEIPKFVVNLVQVNMPYDFIKSLDKYASKTHLKPLPGLQNLIDLLRRD